MFIFCFELENYTFFVFFCIFCVFAYKIGHSSNVFFTPLMLVSGFLICLTLPGAGRLLMVFFQNMNKYKTFKSCNTLIQKVT